MTTVDYVDPDELARSMQTVAGTLRLTLVQLERDVKRALAALDEGSTPGTTKLAAHAAEVLDVAGQLRGLNVAASIFKLSDADRSAILRGETLV